MSEKQVSRRTFVSAMAVAGAAVATGCPRPRRTNGVTVFKRSARGIHVSNAAKKNNFNKLYKTKIAAMRGRAHQGDKSYVVQLIISKQLFNKLFANGNLVADLRHDL